MAAIPKLFRNTKSKIIPSYSMCTCIRSFKEQAARAVHNFDFFKPTQCVLFSPQTKILAIIGSQSMHNFKRNAVLWVGGWVKT